MLTCPSRPPTCNGDVLCWDDAVAATGRVEAPEVPLDGLELEALLGGLRMCMALGISHPGGAGSPNQQQRVPNQALPCPIVLRPNSQCINACIGTYLYQGCLLAEAECLTNVRRLEA